MTMAPKPDHNLYLMLGEMRGMLSTIMAQLDAANAKHDVLSERLDRRIDKNDARITKLETSSWRIAGIASIFPVALAVVSVVFAYLKL